MTFEKLKAAIMPTALSIIGAAQIPEVAHMLPPWLVGVVSILAAIFHAGDTMTDKREWR